MINIVIISEFFGGGVEKVNTILAEKFNKNIYKITLISLVSAPEDIGDDWKFQYVCLNVQSKKKSLRKLLNVLKDICPQVIITSCLVETYFSLIYKRLYSNTVKLIYVQHSVWSKNLKSFKALVLNSYFTKFVGIFNKIDALVFVSKGVESDFCRSVHDIKARTEVIYNPIIDEHSKYEFNEIDIKKISLITVGRLEPEKCQEDIIKAVAILSKKGYNVALTVLGKGSMQDYLENAARNSRVDTQIRFLGFVCNVEEEMKKHDIFILSSIYESFGNAIVEAMNVGVPIISTDCPVGPAEILNNGEFGILVPMCNSQAIADAILETINMHTEERVRKAYNRSVEYSIQNSLSRYEELIQNLVEDTL